MFPMQSKREIEQHNLYRKNSRNHQIPKESKQSYSKLTVLETKKLAIKLSNREYQ